MQNERIPDYLCACRWCERAVWRWWRTGLTMLEVARLSGWRFEDVVRIVGRRARKEMAAKRK